MPGDKQQTENELFFLTDSAYLSLIDEQQPPPPSGGNQSQDGLFLERLDSFVEGQMRDMAAFASREQRSLDEIRKLVAITHAKFLFSSQHETATSGDTVTPSVRTVLARVSRTLQLLHSTAGLESLLLAVAPTPPTAPASSTAEASWIGGTELGKDFWMDLKGGGIAGIRSLRAKCRPSDTNVPPVAAGQSRGGEIKTELNAAVRHALRKASGNPKAEMRWTRPSALEDTYGVRMHGWPQGVLRRNPSNNTVRENRTLLEGIRNGTMRFVGRDSAEWDGAAYNPDTTKGTHPGSSRMRESDLSHVSVSPVVPSSTENSQSSLTPSVKRPSSPSAESSMAHSKRSEMAKRPADVDEDQTRRNRRREDAGSPR